MYILLFYPCLLQENGDVNEEADTISYVLSLLIQEKLPHILRISAHGTVKCLKSSGFKEPVPFP